MQKLRLALSSVHPRRSFSLAFQCFMSRSLAQDEEIFFMLRPRYKASTG